MYHKILNKLADNFPSLKNSTTPKKSWVYLTHKNLFELVSASNRPTMLIPKPFAYKEGIENKIYAPFLDNTDQLEYLNSLVDIGNKNNFELSQKLIDFLNMPVLSDIVYILSSNTR